MKIRIKKDLRLTGGEFVFWEGGGRRKEEGGEMRER